MSCRANKHCFADAEQDANTDDYFEAVEAQAKQNEAKKPRAKKQLAASKKVHAAAQANNDATVAGLDDQEEDKESVAPQSQSLTKKSKSRSKGLFYPFMNE